MDTIIINTYYDNIDFARLFINNKGYYSSGEAEYHIDITDFKGNVYDNFDYTKIYNFLYQTYKGSKTIWNGYIGGHFHSHYTVILIEGSKYMIVRYGTDDYPSKPSKSHFMLNNEIYDSFEKLWSELNNQEKAALIKVYV